MRKPSETNSVEVIFNKFIPFGNYFALTFFGKVLIRESNRGVWEELVSNGLANITKNHEMIHIKQAQFCDDSWLKFYWKYAVEWLKNKPWKNGCEFAYFMNPFEIEAYENDVNLSYNDNKLYGNYDWLRLKKLSLEYKLNVWYDFKHSKKHDFGQFLRDNNI